MKIYMHTEIKGVARYLLPEDRLGGERAHLNDLSSKMREKGYF